MTQKRGIKTFNERKRLNFLRLGISDRLDRFVLWVVCERLDRCFLMLRVFLVFWVVSVRLDRCFLILLPLLAALLSDSKEILEVSDVVDLASSFFHMMVRFHDDFFDFGFRMNISSELLSIAAIKGSGISIDLGTPLSIKKCESNISESILPELNICESIVILESNICESIVILEFNICESIVILELNICESILCDVNSKSKLVPRCGCLCMDLKIMR